MHTARLGKVKVNGASHIRITGVFGHEFEYEGRGKAEVTLAGMIDKLDLNVRGDNNINAKHLKSHQVKIDSVGHLHAVVQVIDHLDLNIFGRAKVQYLGAPRIERHVFGKAIVESFREKNENSA